MTPEAWTKARRVCEVVWEGGGSIESLCEGDEALQALVQELLDADRDASTFLESPPEMPALDEAEDAPASTPVGTVFGQYEVLEQLGTGGMGEVVLARQRQPRREVALKILPAARGGARDEQAFLRESEALGRLSHPNIAQVFEAGVHAESGTEAGRPFIAMERIDGHSLTQWAQESSASVDDRVRLFVKVCEGIAHAHQRGVIHRDIKPSNILVTSVDGVATAKIIDFGIARLSAAESDDTPGEDGGAQLVGTIPYMSPEQVRGDANAIDTRTDIYALGAVLYELLSGRRAFGAEGRAFETMRAICEESPTALRLLNPAVSRDLEAVAHKALSKAPEERYQSASEMTADLRRTLLREPVTARRPGAMRIAARFVRRHRIGATVALVIGLVTMAIALTQRGEAARADATFLRASTASMTLAELPAATLAEVVSRGNRLLESRGSLPADIEGVRVDLNALLRARLDDVSRAFAEVDGSVGRVEEGTRLVQVNAARRAAQELATVCAQGERVSPFLDASLAAEARAMAAQTDAATIAVDRGALAGVGDGATLTVYSLMGFPGSPTAIAQTSVDERVQVAPGYYRARVTLGDGRVREWSMLLRVRERAALTPDWASEPATEDMALIAGARFAIPTGTWGERHPYAGAVVEIEPFLMDKHEVTNAAYRRFYDTLEASERAWRKPRVWDTLDYPSGRSDGEYAPHELDDLPVAGVNWFSANAYAAWAGKRLPTFAEWLLACVGTEGRTHPSGEWEGATMPANVHAPIDSRYEDFAASVRSMAEGASPEGVLHLFGNVQEWTESVGFAKDDDGLETALLSVRMFMGGAWDALARRQAPITPQRHDTDRSSRAETLGFRCAMSVVEVNEAEVKGDDP